MVRAHSPAPRATLTIQCQRCAMKRELRSKSVGTKVSEVKLRVIESPGGPAGLTLSEWVRDVLLGSSVEMGTLVGELAAILVYVSRAIRCF